MKRFSSIMVRTMIALICLTMLVLAFIILIFEYTMAENQYRSNVRQQEKNIQSITTLLDRTFFDYLSLSAQINTVERLRPVNLRKYSVVSQIEGKKLLQTLRAVDSSIIDLCLYLRDDDFFLTTGGTFQPDSFAKCYYRCANYSGAELRDAFVDVLHSPLIKGSRPLYIPTGTMYTTGNETMIADALLILTPVPQWSSNPYAVLGVFIETADICEQLALVVGEGAARVVDDQGHTLAAVGEGNLERGFDDDPNVRVYRNHSTQFGLTYELHVREDVLRRVNLDQSPLFLLLLILALSSILASLLFAKWVNQPLRELLRHLGGGGRFGLDESAYLRQYIYQLNSDVEKNARSADELLVRRLLAGTLLNDDELSHLESILKKDYAHCTAMVVRLGKRPENKQPFFTLEHDHALINIIQEIRPQTLICIIACDETGEALVKLAESLRAEVLMKDATALALGSVEEDLTLLHSSMLRAEALMKEMLYQGKGGVAMADRHIEPRSSYPAKEMYALKAALQADDGQKILGIGNQLAQALLDQRMNSETGVFVIYDLAMLFPELSGKVAAPANIFCDALRTCLSERATACAQKAASPLDGETAQNLKENIMTDIETLLEQPGFGISMISQKYGYTDSAFSHMFKKIFGVNFISYINQQKIQRAKTILLDETVTLDAVASRLGYSSASNFTRMFKNAEGVTPSAYRQFVQTGVEQDPMEDDA